MKKFISRLIAVVTAIVLMVSAWGGTIDPRQWALPSIATLFLPIVTMVAAVVTALLVVSKQWRSALIVVLAAVLCWPSLRLVVAHPGSSYDDSGVGQDSLLTVLTMNVGLFDWTGTNPNASMEYILNQDVDIVVMQEATIYGTFEQQRTLRSLLDRMHKQYPYRTTTRRDRVIMSKWPYTAVIDNRLADNGASAWDVHLPGGDVRVMNIHLASMYLSSDDRHLIDSLNTSGGRVQRLRSVSLKLRDAFAKHADQAIALREFIDGCDGDLLVLGDMNDTPASYAYRTLRGRDLHDAWAQVGHGIGHTFHGNHLFVKIDHVFYRGNLQAVDCHCVRAGDSDHYPIVARFVR